MRIWGFTTIWWGLHGGPHYGLYNDRFENVTGAVHALADLALQAFRV